MVTFGWTKFSMLVATAVFAGLGIIKDFKNKESGGITPWGQIAIGGVCLSLLISLYTYYQDAEKEYLSLVRQQQEAMEAKSRYEETQRSLDAARKTLNDTFNRATDQVTLLDGLRTDFQKEFSGVLEMQRRTLKAQREALANENQIHLWQFRGEFPLTPLTISFNKTYSLKDPSTFDYQKRLIDLALTDLNPKTAILSSLFTGRDILLLEREEPRQDDGSFYNTVTGDIMKFRFAGAQPDEDVIFKCIQQSPNTKYYLNFKTSQLTKVVMCKDLFPVAQDTLAISSLDLVGRTLTWEGATRVASFLFREDFGGGEVNRNDQNLTGISLTFPYNRDYARVINIPNGVSGIMLTSKSLGLRSIFDSQSKPIPTLSD